MATMMMMTIPLTIMMMLMMMMMATPFSGSATPRCTVGVDKQQQKKVKKNVTSMRIERKGK